jgi:homospermidine synthase
MINRLLLLGMGTIQRSLAELLQKKRHKLLKTVEVICVCPEDIPEYIYDIYPNLKHIKTHLTDDNQNKLLSSLMDNQTLCIDLTVDTDSISIISLARKNNCLYINTSIEEYQKDDIKNPEKRTLYYQGIQLDKSLKKVKSNTSIIESGGANPGLISNLTMMAIHKYCEDHKPNLLKFIKKNKWSYVASKCVSMIHCAEKDTQDTNYKAKKDYLYNTWSPAGLISEAKSPSFLSSPAPPSADYHQSKYNKNMYINPDKHSMDCFTESYIITPDNKVEKIIGRMITHNEVISMSDLFSTKNYVPIISYVYDSCPISQQSLELMKKNNYKDPKHLMPLYQKDIINKDSYDSLGACVFFNDGKIYWCGSVLTNNQTMNLLHKNCCSNATQLQVSIAVLAYIEYLLTHKNEGVLTSEDLPYKKIIDYCKPYLGKFICKEIKT